MICGCMYPCGCRGPWPCRPTHRQQYCPRSSPTYRVTNGRGRHKGVRPVRSPEGLCASEESAIREVAEGVRGEAILRHF